MKKKKILFVAMQMSIHTARWINQLDREKYDIHLFPVNSVPLHPDLKDVTVHAPLLEGEHRHFQDIIKEISKYIFAEKKTSVKIISRYFNK